MKQLQLVTLTTILTFFSMGCSAAQPPTTTSEARQVEAVIDHYFKAFHSKNLAGMKALSSPNIEVVDYGQRFSLDEWNWYMKWSFTAMNPYQVRISNFNTRLFSDFAYTTFNMRGGEPDILEVANAVLRRRDGQWFIELLSIEKGQAWYGWLRERIKNGQDVSNWYADYEQEMETPQE